jgi:outer membrane protein TolC
MALGLLVWATSAAAESAPLNVEDCVRLAVARSPAARAAGFDVDAALARLRAARAAYAPRLSAQAEYGRAAGFDEVITNGGSTAALLTIETSWLDGGLRDAQFAAAGARLRSAKAREQQRRADIAFAVRAAYFTAVASHAEVAIQQGAQQTLRDYESLLQRQERLGLVTRNDVLRARLAADNTGAAERAAAAERDAALSELGTLTGAALTTASLLEPPATHVPFADTAAIETSPVLIDAQAAVEAARRETDAVRSEWRAHLQLTASGGALGVVPERTFRDNGGGQFLVGFTLPLYDGGATAARVAAAAATADGAEALLRESRQTMVTALARTRVDARRAEADLTAWQGAVPRATENFELMRARYFGGGNVRLLEVLDALTQSVDAQLAVQRATFAGRLVVAKQQQLVGEATP